MIFEWEKYKKIIENEFAIVNKKKVEVPFILNPAQNDIIRQLTDQNIILKARKLGFSSLMLGIGMAKFLFGKNEKVVSMSFDQSASARQLLRAKTFLRAFEYKNKVTIPLKYNTKNEMALEAQDETGGYTNTLVVGTAKSTSFGRGDDITFLHLTEVAQNNNLQMLLASVGEALVDNAMLTLETTANGYGEFKDFWDASVRGETGFRTFFYNSKWEYSDEYLERRRQKLGYLFPQEYPMTPEEAFIKMGGKVYPEFDTTKHVEVFELDPNKKYTKLFGQDFAVRGWNAVIPIFIDTEGEIWIPDNYKKEGITAEQHFVGIKKLLTDYSDLSSYVGYADPAGWAKNQQKGDMMWSLADEYLEMGLSIVPANNEVTGGINYVKQLFTRGKIHIHPRCTDLIEELMQYQWKPLPPTRIGEINDPEVVRKINDHLVDALRYVLYSKSVAPDVDKPKPRWKGGEVLTFKPWWIKDETKKEESDDKFTPIEPHKYN
jgi:hypothetical protein